MPTLIALCSSAVSPLQAFTPGRETGTRKHDEGWLIAVHDAVQHFNVDAMRRAHSLFPRLGK